MRAIIPIVSSHMKHTKPKPFEPEKRPTQARAKATVAAIVEATAHILSASGYDALTTNKVAERAGVSIGSLYQYFPNKEALVAEVVDQHCDRVDALMAEVFMSSVSAPPPALARAMVAAFYELKAEDPDLARVLREQLPRLGQMQRLEHVMARITEMVAVYLASKPNLLRVKDPALAAFFAVELVESLVMAAVIKRPRVPAARIIDEITDMVLRYLLRAAPARKVAVRGR